MDQQNLIAIAFKMTVAFGAVLLTFGASLLIARRFSGGPGSLLKKGKSLSAKPLEILAHQSLGPGRNLYLIRCLNKKILVGSTNNSVQAISDIEEEESSSPESEGEIFGAHLEEKIGETTDKNMIKRFGSSLKDIARI